MPTHLDVLADRARDYADRASSDNTRLSLGVEFSLKVGAENSLAGVLA